MTLRIVIINGAGGSGKDTFVNFVKNYFPGTVKNHSTVGVVKQAARLFGAKEELRKGEAERALWCKLKDAYTAYNDGPYHDAVWAATELELAPHQEGKALMGYALAA